MRNVTPVLHRNLRENWLGTLGWTIGVTAVLFMYLPLFPSIVGNGQMQQIIDSMPTELVNALGYEQISSGAGYAQGTFYGLIGFLLLTFAAASWGAGAIAGAEESGRLELDLAHAIGRIRYAVESAAAVCIRILWLGLLAATIVALLNGPAELNIEPGRIVDATIAFTGLTLLAGTVALLTGALSGRRSWGITAGAGFAVAGYAFNAIANQTADADWLRVISPYSWAYHQPPLAEGIDPWGAAALWGLNLLFIAGSVWALRRRDIIG